MNLRFLLRGIALSFILFFITKSIVKADSCLPGWKYKMNVDITNPGSLLEDFQVLIEFNSASYVSAGKMNISGSDIRFMDNNNNLLSYWIVPKTFNTTVTQIWVKVSEIPNGAPNIYMFYGNNSAYSNSNGNETFVFFDNFEEGNANWELCGGSYYLSNGELVLYSTLDNNFKTILKTSLAYTAPFISEMGVESVTGDNQKQISLVQINSSDEGFGLSSMQSAGSDQMEIARFNSDAECYSYSSPFGPANLSSGLGGTWQFVWNSPNNQNGIKSDGGVNLLMNDVTYTYPTSLKSGIAIYGSEASVTIDWFRIRKWAAIEPSVSLDTGSETALPDASNINEGSNSPLCAGETLTLFADDIGSGATYKWYNPSGVEISNSVVPSPITNMTPAKAGTYQLIVAPTSGSCSSITVDVYVEVYPETVAGTIEGETEVCSGINSGYIELKDYIGEIVRWEYSLTGGDPWATIDNNSSRQDYQNLTQTTYYRAVIKSGECSTVKSDIACVTVSSTSNAGTATGNTIICKNESANISLAAYNADNIYWQKSLDELNWANNGIVTSNLNTGNIDTTNYYRAIVSNGVCQTDTSNTVEIIVNCESVGGTLEFDTVCFGSSGELQLSDYIGKIIRWEESINGGKPWTTVQETSNKLIYENVTQTKYYRVVVQNAGCDTVYSDVGRVVVDQNPTAEEIIGDNTVCFQENVGEVVLSDYTGEIVRWEFSIDDKNSWNNIDSKEDTIQYSNLEKTSFYRARVQSDFDYCSGIYSDAVKVEVNATTIGGTTGNNAIVCKSDNEGVIRLTSHIGDIVRWEKSTRGMSPWDVIATTDDSLCYNDLKENTYYRAIVQNGVCSVEISDSTLIRVDDISNAGIITGSVSQCAENNQGSLILTNKVGDVLKWEKSVDQTNWQFKTYTTPEKIEYSNLDETTYYRVITKNGVCQSDTSDITSINIHPLPVVDFTADTAEIGDPTHFTNKSTILSGTLTEFQWDFDNGTSSTAKNPIENYSEAQTYFVSLKVKSDKSCLDSIKKAVLVLPKPEVDFTATNVCLGDTVFFKNNSIVSEGTVTYLWDFGDGKTSTFVNPNHKFEVDGVFSVTLNATTDKGVKSSISKDIVIYPRANVDFDFDDVCQNKSINLINNSSISDGSLSFYWNFGDNETSTSINPTHKYDENDDYTIELITTSNYFCKDTLIKTITIYPNPLASFETTTVPYQTVSEFTDLSAIESGSIANWNWDFGDGNYSNVQNPEYLFTSPGNYLVSLSISSDFGCASSFAKNVNITPLPNASFTAENVCLGNAVSFINQTSILSGELIYEWNFGDENTSNLKSPVHLYEDAGLYAVTLIVTSETDGKDTVQKDIEIYPNPEPAFHVFDVCDGYPSNFVNSSEIKSGNINIYSWDFGDGTNSVQTNPIKQYLNADVYNVKLKATSDRGCESEVTEQAYVRKNPLADFSLSNECLGVNVNITNHSKSDEGNVSYYWEFGDGSNSILENPDHHYLGSGIYTVKLVTRSSYQCVDSLLRNVTIFDLPLVDAGEDTLVSKGFSIRMQASGANIFDWSPAESLDNPGIFNPIARPMETTTYSVRGIDNNGCENTDEVTVKINNDYQLIASNILTPDYNGQNDTWKITNIDAFETATVYIFNRWGDEVYNKKGYQNDWDGRNMNGDVLPDGTYYYVVKFADSNKHYSGSITLLRNQ